MAIRLSDLSGQTLGGLELGEMLGQGGMGAVFKARQISLDREVAVKVLNPGAIRDQDDIDAFRAESRTAAQLKHPGIVQVYEAGEQDGLYFFAMEYVRGHSVLDWIAEDGPVSQRYTIAVAQNVAEALGYAWDRASMIHCDLKPQNILIDDDGTPKVTDLGLAALASHELSSSDDFVACTPNYAAPEQLTREFEMDCRSDIYSLGLTLYHMVTGVVPFGEEDFSKIGEANVYGNLPDPREVNPAISGPLAVLLQKMTAKSMDDRHAGWDELLSDLVRIYRKKPILKPLPPHCESTILRVGSDDGSAPARPARMSDRYRQSLAQPQKKGFPMGLVLGGIAAIVVLGVVLGYAMQRRPTPRPADASRVFVMSDAPPDEAPVQVASQTPEEATGRQVDPAPPRKMEAERVRENSSRKLTATKTPHSISDRAGDTSGTGFDLSELSIVRTGTDSAKIAVKCHGAIEPGPGAKCSVNLDLDAHKGHEISIQLKKKAAGWKGRVFTPKRPFTATIESEIRGAGNTLEFVIKSPQLPNLDAVGVACIADQGGKSKDKLPDTGYARIVLE